ncbi:GNAT superfamily N-acetyltransferase [Nocardiopsis arvandica]|uniref:GNAT superfamily N-acetyltransferase n=1 Tax=Nocardiopsis sinuspersici TaxID=501010 RepID=A0A7Y9XA96_9ACTN|nr:GNAT family N-acetyltransferase [Nocardiopsis sinuspersici]NYH51869.1 GNAT superfamily N-acetyltransferase [Nocardiopsis sinuspersici]
MSPTVTAAARPATIDDVAGIARVLSRSAHEDPFFRWLFPDDELRVARTRRFFALTAGFGYVPAGGTRVTETQDDSEDAPVVRGAAMWAPPGTNPEGQLVSLRTWPHWASLIGRSRMAAFVRVFAEWKLAAPQEPHLYLAALGVDPAVAGTGIGGGLLSSGLDRADSERLPVFTHTLDDKTVGFYERFGFRVLREVESPDAGTNYFLLRDPS